MQVNILYFASLRQALGKASEQVELSPEVRTVGALRDELAARGEGWEALGPSRNVRAAVNQRMAGPDEPIAAGDEVAFFPPVTGG